MSGRYSKSLSRWKRVFLDLQRRYSSKRASRKTLQIQDLTSEEAAFVDDNCRVWDWNEVSTDKTGVRWIPEASWGVYRNAREEMAVVSLEHPLSKDEACRMKVDIVRRELYWAKDVRMSNSQLACGAVVVGCVTLDLPRNGRKSKSRSGSRMGIQRRAWNLLVFLRSLRKWFRCQNLFTVRAKKETRT